MLRYICHHWPGEVHQRDAVVSLLDAARSQSPDLVADLLVEPHVAAWASWLSRRLRGTYEPGYPIEVDLAYLSALAAVAAWRAGVAGEAQTVAGPDGVFLPTVGLLPGVPVGPATLRVSPAAIGVVGSRATTASGDLVALRQLTVGDPPYHLRVTLDDLDPYRGRYHIEPSDRLDGDEPARWQEALERAWILLTKHCPAQAGELAAGLRTLVPLRASGPGVASSATAMDAFGGVGLTFPWTDVDFAVTLVHEFQHSKLAAFLDMASLHDPGHQALYFAPWRSDPRPLGGLFQGTYAFLGVAEAWHGLASTVGEAGVWNLADTREQVAAGLAALERSGALTQEGGRFTAGLRVRLRRLQQIPVPPELVEKAQAALRATHRDWQKRNDRVDPM
jgi:HEXXH motif-containing protein